MRCSHGCINIGWNSCWDCFIIVGIIINGTLQSFYDLASIMIVLGGTLAETMVSYPFKRLVGFTRVVKSFLFI